jgi:NAD(P)-dependent dehydrogenase (short-subunit alcohol dehydrogenase family)
MTRTAKATTRPFLKGKKALLIGGSGIIGRAIARTFLDEGAEVICATYRPREVEEAKRLIPEASFRAVDCADIAKMQELAETIKAEWGHIDILVNAAAIAGPIAHIFDTDPEEWRRSIEVTLLGTYHGIRFFGPLMPRGAVIINFVGGGEGPLLRHTSYVAAKGGIMRLNETAAAELADQGIRVNAIAPGPVNSQFLIDMIAAGPEKAGQANYERALKQQQSGGVSPDKAAALCRWLASDESIGITGKIFSAQWDPYEDLPAKDIMTTDVYTMRRVRPKDRGFDWDPFDRLR